MKGIAVTVDESGRRDFVWRGGASYFFSSPLRGLGFNLNLGGSFTSVPVAAASLAQPPLVLDPGVLITPAVAPRPLGGVAGTGSRVHRLVICGLGNDFAMYSKQLWGDFDRHDPSPWTNLGGVFTSTPAVIAWAGDRVDVFGLGTDHAMVTKSLRRSQGFRGYQWSPNWQSLGGAFTSAASLVASRPDQLDVFARGADFTLRRNHTDGSTWFGWQNLGGNLASPPVAVSWGPDRIDVFAIFRDRALWHRWWDGMIWNDWESLGGPCIGEPTAAVVAPGHLEVFVVQAEDRRLRQLSFSQQTWSQPRPLDGETVGESASAAVTGPGRIELFAPAPSGQIRLRRWDGSRWSVGSAGAGTRLPCRYRLSVDLVRARTPRALNNDTDAAVASLAVGNWPTDIHTQWIGKIGNSAPDSSQTNLLDFEPITIELAEAMSFSYMVVNNGHADKEKILAELAKAGDSLSLASVSSTSEDITKGIVSFVNVKIVEALTVPVIGSIVGKIESWLLGKLKDAIFKSCDGIVATELIAMMGRDLFRRTNNGTTALRVTTRHPGTPSPTFCGGRSDYEVTWSIKPL